MALYRQRWRVEDAFAIVKRLLGLAYFYCGAEQAIEMQVWATWLLYAVLIDLTGAVAEALARPFAEVSVERVYRSLYLPDERRRPRFRPPTRSVIWLTMSASWALSTGLVKKRFANILQNP